MNLLLNHIEQLLRDDSGHAALDNNIRIFVFADVTAAREHPPDSGAVISIAAPGLNAMISEISAQLTVIRSVHVQLESVQHMRSDIRIYLICLIRTDEISDRAR